MPTHVVQTQDAAEALARVRLQMAQAQAERGLLGAQDVTLVAVSKHQPVHKMAALYDLGVRDFAENYVQQLVDKAQQLAATGRRPRWHLIGHLQSNKVAAVTALGALVHTVDSLKLAQKIAAAPHSAQNKAQPVPVLMQVRLSADARRPGVAYEHAAALAEQLLHMQNLRLVGLMGVPPQDGCARPHFAKLARLQRSILATPLGQQVQHLSMGMSEDFRDAILEGATMVRVGSALFGPRTQDPGDHP